MEFKFSLTIGGLIAFIIVLFVEARGIQIGPEEVSTFILVAGKIISAIAIYIGRLRKGDIKWYGARR